MEYGISVHFSSLIVVALTKTFYLIVSDTVHTPLVHYYKTKKCHNKMQRSLGKTGNMCIKPGHYMHPFSSTSE